MQCEQVEKRLNHLLDQRRHWSDDPVLVAHCAWCRPCRQLAEAYATVDLVFDDASNRPQLSPGFSSRVLAEMSRRVDAAPSLRLTSGPIGKMSADSDSPRSTPRKFVRGHSARNLLWVAAALFVVAVPAALWMQPGVSPSLAPGAIDRQVSVRASRHLPDRLVLLLDDDRRLSEDVWRTTGRGIAELPHQVRRAVALSETAPLTGAIRPVAGAWQAFWRVLPGESVRAEPAAGETGFLVEVPEDVWA